MNIHTPGFDPSMLDMVMRDRDFVVYYNDGPLLSPKGREICHPKDRLIRNLITELYLRKQFQPDAVNLFSLFEFFLDEIPEEQDPFLEGFESLLEEDPFIHLKRGGKPAQGFNGESGTGDLSSPEMFYFHFWSNTNLLKAINGFAGEQMYKLEESEDVHNPLERLIKEIYRQSSPERKAAIRMLSQVHGAWISLPMLLVMGRITPPEYCKGLLSLKVRSEPTVDWLARYPLILREAHSASDFIEALSDTGEHGHSFHSLIREGEGDLLEFKSTLRWDLKAWKTNQAVERAALKTVTAFLNTNGGTLIIGIRDDGSVEGIESDRFPNEDKFLLHLWTLIRTCLGRDVSPYIRTRLEKTEEKTICVVRCSRSNRPVFLRQPGFNEEFYIRVGPGSAAMDISEALKYIADHFSK